MKLSQHVFPLFVTRAVKLPHISF